MAQKTVFHTDIYIEKELEQETSGDIQILAKRTTDNKTVWVEAGGGGGIESVSGDSVDNTDPLNPVINAIPLTGTTEGNPVTGDVEFEEGYSSLGFIKKTTDENFYGRFQMSDTGAEIFVSDIGTSNNLVSLVVSKENQRVQISSTNPLSSGLSGIEDFTSNITALDYVQKKYVDDAVAGAGGTNLSYTPSPTNGTVNSDTGTDAIIQLADGTNAGLMPAAFYTVYPETAYTETVTWGGTAPVTMQNSTWQATKIGNRLSLRMNINYATAGAGSTTAQVPLPTGVPLPSSITGFTSNNSYVAVGSAIVSTGITSNPTISRAVLRRETGTTYSVYNSFSSGAYNTIIIDIEYFTD